MDKQPEALQIADDLEFSKHYSLVHIAAAELRRLHQVNQELVGFVELVSILVIVPPMMTEQARQLMMLQDKAQAILAKHKEQV